MFEIGEVVTLIVTIVLVCYLYSLLGSQKRSMHSKWFYGIILVVLSQACTVIEGYVLPNAFNYLEHFLFTIASFLFLLSILKKEL